MNHIIYFSKLIFTKKEKEWRGDIITIVYSKKSEEKFRYCIFAAPPYEIDYFKRLFSDKIDFHKILNKHTFFLDIGYSLFEHNKIYSLELFIQNPFNDFIADIPIGHGNIYQSNNKLFLDLNINKYSSYEKAIDHIEIIPEFEFIMLKKIFNKHIADLGR